MSISMFDTRVMVRSLEQLYEPKTFLRDFYFGAVETHGSRYVDIDIVKGGRDVASYVKPVHEGVTVEDRGYTAKSYKAPYVKEKMTTDAQKFLKREAGQTVYSQDSAGARAQRELGKNLRNLSERFDRLEELQASQALQQGKIIVKGEGYDEEIDFGFAASHLPTLAGTAKWDDATNCDPQLNLQTWFHQIGDDSGLYPTDAVMGQGSANNLIRATKFKNMLDNRRIQMGEIVPGALSGQGVRYLGYLNDPGIDLWVYTGLYYDKISKTTKRYLADESVVMVGSGARATRHYGAIEDVENEAVEIQRFPKSWVSKDPSARWVMLQSAPLVVPHQVDAFLCATTY